MRPLIVEITATLITFGSSFDAFGIVIGGSNLGLFGYPSHNCTAPYSKPNKPYTFNTQAEVDRYNSKVEEYNRKANRFIDCIEEFIENSNNDIRRIKEKANEAINAANRL